ncbi:ras GEF [Hesseltinella vesiculosa]|uniref:Ras GEF n=1 Tax=Hesseltinella vesiculosa TaxID=101127 RepID=A0A1X2G6X0_9FUNG|nr:ras GEF [Hesseltinella vesiculosa]
MTCLREAFEKRKSVEGDTKHRSWPDQHYYDDPYFFDLDDDDFSPDQSLSEGTSSFTSYTDTLSDVFLYASKLQSLHTKPAGLKEHCLNVHTFKKKEHVYHKVNSQGQTTLIHECLHGKLQVVSGDREQLFLKLVDHQAPQDMEYIDVYLLNFIHFGSPLTLMQQFIDKIHDDSRRPFQKQVTSRWLHALQRWIQLSIESLMQQPQWAKKFDQLCHKVLPPLGMAVQASMLKSTFYNETYLLETRPRINMSQFSITLDDQSSPFASLDPTDIARYLTLCDSFLFQQLQLHHFLEAKWRDQPYDAIPLSKLEEKADYIGLLTKRANMLHQWVLQEMHNRHTSTKARKSALKKWIHVAKLCLEWNNFHTSMILTMALLSTSIQKMDAVWGALSHKNKATFDILQQLVDVSNNMSCYRQALEHGLSPIHLAWFSQKKTSNNTSHRKKSSSTSSMSSLPMLSPSSQRRTSCSSASISSTPLSSSSPPIPTLYFLPVVLKDLVFLMDGPASRAPVSDNSAVDLVQFSMYYDTTRYAQRVVQAAHIDYWFATHPPALPFLSSFDQYPSCPSLTIYKIIEQALVHSNPTF